MKFNQKVVKSNFHPVIFRTLSFASPILDNMITNPQNTPKLAIHFWLQKRLCVKNSSKDFYYMRTNLIWTRAFALAWYPKESGFLYSWDDCSIFLKRCENSIFNILQNKFVLAPFQRASQKLITYFECTWNF